jgi:hypothetical protein
VGELRKRVFMTTCYQLVRYNGFRQLTRLGPAPDPGPPARPREAFQR